MLRARNPGRRPSSREVADEIATAAIPEYEDGWHAQAELVYMGRGDPTDDDMAREIASKAYPDGPAVYREAVDLARASIFRDDDGEFARSLDQGLAREIGIEPEWIVAQAIAHARGGADEEATLRTLWETPGIPELAKARHRLEEFSRAMGESAGETEVAERLLSLFEDNILGVGKAFDLAEEALCSVSDEQLLRALEDRHAETFGKADAAASERTKSKGRRA